jgi:hypothetical protein
MAELVPISLKCEEIFIYYAIYHELNDSAAALSKSFSLDYSV